MSLATRGRRPGTRSLAAAALLACAAAGCGDVAPPPPPAPPPFDAQSYPVRHVFVSLRADSKDPERPRRTPAEAREVARAVVARLREPGADFATVAATWSDEPATAGDGGFAGFVASWAGDDPEVLRVVSALPEGGVSEPFETQGRGFQVFQRLSREEGKRIEAAVTAPVEGFMVPWAGLDVSVPAGTTKADAYADAARVARSMRDGATLEEVFRRLQGVRPFSAVFRRGPSKGYDAMVGVALAATPGVWLDPVETPDGWAVTKRRPYVRCYVRHLLVAHRESVLARPPAAGGRPVLDVRRSREEAEALARAALARVRADPAAWDRVVLETSDEEASRVRGGFMGEVCTAAEAARRPAPEVEEAVLALAPGEVSEVVSTRFGFHVFWRVD